MEFEHSEDDLSPHCQTGLAVTCQSGSRRPKSARTAQNIAAVGDMICSQENQPGTSKSSCQIAKTLGMTDPFGTSRKWISSCQLFGTCQRRFSAMPLNLNGWNDAELFWDVRPLIRWNRCSLLTKRISIWTLLWTPRMIACGPKGRRKRSQALDCWQNEKSLCHIWWYVLACATVVKDGCTSWKKKRRSMQTIIPPSYCQTRWKMADIPYPVNLSFSKLWHKTGLAVIVQISFERMNGHPTHQI